MERFTSGSGDMGSTGGLGVGGRWHVARRAVAAGRHGGMIGAIGAAGEAVHVCSSYREPCV